MQTVNNKLKYFLEVVILSTTYELHPLGESSFAVSWDLNNAEDDPRYGYDLKFSGSFTFVGEDYLILKGLEESGYRCADLLFTLYSNGCGGPYDYIFPYTKLRLTDGVWNMDKCTVTLPVVDNDPYECINEKKGDSLNMFAATGAPQSVRLADYVPTFEYSYYASNEDGQDIASQSFSHYPNRKAQYPGFSVEGQTADPYWPESATVIIVDEDLTVYERDPLTYEEYLSTGSIPRHANYPSYSGAFDAVAEGWRLYSFRVEIFNDVTTANTLGYHRRFRWCREILDLTLGDPSPGAEWFYVGVVGGFDRWARPPILMPRTNIYEPSIRLIAFPNEARIKWVMTTYIVGAPTNVVNLFDEVDEAGGVGSNGNVYGFDSLPNGVTLNEIISYAVGHCCPDLTVKSEYFQINPDVATTTNPVSGVESFTDRIMVFQKSDVKRPFASEHATKGEFTFEELFKWLLGMFKVKYTIFGTDFRIEHISSDYFVRPATIDTTIAPYNTCTAGLRIYSYESGILPAKWTFKFMDTRSTTAVILSDDFAGTPILFYGSCVSRKDKEGVFLRDVSRVSTDIMYIMQNSGGVARVIDNKTANPYTVYEDASNGTIDDDGFCFVAYQDVSGTLFGVRKDPILDTISRYNNVLGWAYLHEWFHRFDANAVTGKLNDNDVTFATTKYIKKQVPLSFTICCVTDFDPYEQITTALGTGVIRKATWKPTTSTMEVEVAFQIT